MQAQQVLPTVPVMRMQIIMEMQFIMGTQPVETPPGTPPAQHLLVAAVATAICTGRDIWQVSMPITSATSHPLQGRPPRRQDVRLLPQQQETADAAPVIPAVDVTDAIPAVGVADAIPAADAADAAPVADAACEGLTAAHVI